MVKFPQFKLEVYDTIDSVPEAVKKAMEEQTETPSLVRAWTDDAGVVHLIAEDIIPFDAKGHFIIVVAKFMDKRFERRVIVILD